MPASVGELCDTSTWQQQGEHLASARLVASWAAQRAVQPGIATALRAVRQADLANRRVGLQLIEAGVHFIKADGSIDQAVHW